MAILFDAIAAAAAWSSIALLVWGAALCIGELLVCADQALGGAITRPAVAARE